ncbi:Dihydropteroate synthase [Altererythrobacter epoxidivorans]|uniref:dihydropteroate synthase n=1 Tax=Altererythrobacter epoxidivorans TaxID=361183 RepID=A0A0M4MHK2_9SPHN|nr:dihydropteroate synthase [Altererythrobacter epoxidivorans]ALE17043.1 Dihydropteroate synthase [Altererythrobacter epoxidivorans]
MTDRIYIRPIGLASAPQVEEGRAVRLAGGMVYASRFAVILRRDGEVAERWLCDVESVAEVLGRLPDCVAAEAEDQWSNLGLVHPPLECGQRTVRLDQPQVMGILNVTPDSFSDGGAFLDNPEAGRAHASAMLEAGAAIIDIGGESTRPGAPATWEGDEKDRVLPAVEYCSAMGAAISVDTRRAGVLEAALEAGAHIANDVSALRHDPRSVEIAARAGCPVILMHAPGKGDDLHADADYDNVVFDVFDWLAARRDEAVSNGISRSKIVLDPGIGFGKSLAENLALLNALPLFHALGQPILLGGSRKRMIGALSNEAEVGDRLGGSLAVAIAGMNAGVQLLRVHDVFETVQARNVWRGMRDAALTDFSELPEG